MITSASNPQVKYLMQLRKKSKLRKSEGVYIAEGMRMFMEAPGEDILRVYVSESFSGSENAALMGKRDFEVLSDALFARVSDTVTPQGVLCLMRMKTLNAGDVISKECDGLWLLLEGIQDPGNLGTMLRTAEAAGADGIIMDENTVDIYNPKVIRSTMGSIFRVPFAAGADLKEAAALIKSGGGRVYAADIDGRRVYDEADYTKRSAFIIGNEGNGLSDAAKALADEAVVIPMCGETESLNAAMSAGILMYEAQRQRRKLRAAGPSGLE